MAKLFPPIIDSTIPAFYESGGRITITIPFEMNRAVSAVDISTIQLKVKDTLSNAYILTQEASSVDFTSNTKTATFNIANSERKFNLGNFYKFQIAYVSATSKESKEVGYYSSVALGKFTSVPQIFIDEFSQGGASNITKFTGRYINNDYTEKVYSYRFDIYKDSEIIETTGDKIHDNSNNASGSESYDIYQLNKTFSDTNGNHYVQYSITTINGIKLSTQKYKLETQGRLDDKLGNKFVLSVKLNKDNGYVEFQAAINNELDNKESIKGHYLISRSDDGGNSWEDLKRITVKEVPVIPENKKDTEEDTENKEDTEEVIIIDELSYKDFTIEHGKSYIYALSSFNAQNLYSEKKQAVLAEDATQGIIHSEFEDIFLYDGKRQLRVQFNPKINNLKQTVLESKIDTIGSKYPYIVRNGNTNYREFSLSGFISSLIDSENLFMNFNEVGGGYRTTTPSQNKIEVYTSLYDSHNIYKERLFREEVLAWLNNGEVKLFRSPTEGNYLIKLLNISLTPNDALGRALYTFNSQAYEVDTISYDNLLKYNFITDVVLEQKEEDKYEFGKGYESIRLDSETLMNKKDKLFILNKRPTNKIELIHFLPRTEFYILPSKTINEAELENYKIVIGQSGNYRIETDNYNLYLAIAATEKTWMNYVDHSMTFSVQKKYFKSVEQIKNYSTKENIAKQFVGQQDVINHILTSSIEEIAKLDYKTIDPTFYKAFVTERADDGILYPIEIQLPEIYQIQFEKRPLVYIRESIIPKEPIKPEPEPDEPDPDEPEESNGLFVRTEPNKDEWHEFFVLKEGLDGYQSFILKPETTFAELRQALGLNVETQAFALTDEGGAIKKYFYSDSLGHVEIKEIEDVGQLESMLQEYCKNDPINQIALYALEVMQEINLDEYGGYKPFLRNPQKLIGYLYDFRNKKLIKTNNGFNDLYKVKIGNDIIDLTYNSRTMKFDDKDMIKSMLNISNNKETVTHTSFTISDGIIAYLTYKIGQVQYVYDDIVEDLITKRREYINALKDATKPYKDIESLYNKYIASLREYVTTKKEII